jgi:uncharacterized protein (UPF0332 family)
VATEQELWLAKAKECLASAEADFAAGRHNSVANRAYYAAFHAAIAALIGAGIAPRGKAWEHRFVFSEFSGKLIHRRKMFASTFSGTLQILYNWRVMADYRGEDVSRRLARAAVSNAKAFVAEVQAVGKGR